MMVQRHPPGATLPAFRIDPMPSLAPGARVARRLVVPILVLGAVACAESPTSLPGEARPPVQLSLTTAGDEGVMGLSRDFTALYAAGYTTAALDGTHKGSEDVFVRAYEPTGALLWATQFGSTAADRATDVAAATTGYGIAVVGFTAGSIAGSRGGYDVFVRMYSTFGTVQWTRQFGTTGSDYAYGALVGWTGEVYVVGQTDGSMQGRNRGFMDAFVRKYGSSGEVLWTRQWGGLGSDVASDIALDADGNIIVVGIESRGGNNDGFVRKMDATGRLVWNRYISTPGNELAGTVETTETHVVVAGYTSGDLRGSNRGGLDGFLRAYDYSGAMAWTRQIGTASSEIIVDMAASDDGFVTIAGWTFGAFRGTPSGTQDAFYARYDAASGVTSGIRQIDSGGEDAANAVAATPGATFLGGETTGDFVSGSLGGYDGFVMAISSANGESWIDQ